MNLHAHPENYQQDILTAYHNIDLVTTHSTRSIELRATNRHTCLYNSKYHQSVKHATKKKISLLVQVD